MSGRTARIAAAAALLAALGAAGCGEDEAPDPSGPDFGDLEADQVMVEVEHYMTREGVRRAHLNADTVYLRDEGSTAHLRHFTVDFFGEQGERTSVLRAVDGLYDMRQGDMRARQDVRVVDAAESQRLRTEELVYESSTGRLRSDHDFVLLRGRDTIRGTGFITDPGLDSLRTRRPSMVSPPAARAGGSRDTAAPGSASAGPAARGTAPAAGDSLRPDSAAGASRSGGAERDTTGEGPP